MYHVFNFWCHCQAQRNSPTGFILAANPWGDVLLDFLMTDEHGSLDLSSCILPGLIGLHYKLIDYYVTVCIMVNWVIYLEPDCSLRNWDQISYYPDEKFDGCVTMTGNDFPVVLWLKVHCTILNPGSGSSVVWLCILGQETKRESFQNIMINNSFHKWNYSLMRSFLVNWILEQNHSHNCYIFAGRVIMIGFRVIIIFIVFISPLYNRVMCSLMPLATAAS